MVTGTIGDAALGLDILKRRRGRGAWRTMPRHSEMLVGRYRVPQPRTALAKRFAITPVPRWMCPMVWPAISQNCARHRAYPPRSTRQASRCRLLPRRCLRGGAVGIEAIVSGGDDYEILCAIPEDRFEAFAQAGRLAGVPVTSIGD